MGLIIETSDFTGKFLIPKNSYSELGNIISQHEEKYLKELFGIVLFGKFKATISAHASSDPIYQALIDPIEQDYKREVLISEGMKIMLLGFIYWEYVRFTNDVLTTSGFVVQESDVSKSVDLYSTQSSNKYNNSVTSYEVIQWYIKQNIITYPDYNGQCIGRVGKFL